MILPKKENAHGSAFLVAVRKRLQAMLSASLLLLAASGYAGELPLVKPDAVGLSAAKLAEVKSVVTGLIKDEKIAGATVLVARQGRVAMFDTFGMMDRKAGKPVKRDTIFRIYSMTKPITSVAVMMLLEDGKLKLDAPVADYLPALKKMSVYNEKGKPTSPKRPMTVRDLLRHTAGLTYGFFGNTPVDKMYRAQKVLDRSGSLKSMVKKLGGIPLLYEPGSRWHYSVATDVLGALVEAASGQTLNAFFQKRIFTPLGMTDTGFSVPRDKLHRFAACYGPKLGGGLRLVDEPAKSEYLEKPGMASGGGGLVSTASDYYRFCQMLRNKGSFNKVRLLKPESVEQMTRNQLPPGVRRGFGLGFGLGFSVRTRPGLRRKAGASPAGEFGWGGAASTHFWLSPKDDLVVIALSQRRPYSAQLENAVKPLIYQAIKRQ